MQKQDIALLFAKTGWRKIRRARKISSHKLHKFPVLIIVAVKSISLRQTVWWQGSRWFSCWLKGSHCGFKDTVRHSRFPILQPSPHFLLPLLFFLLPPPLGLLIKAGLSATVAHRGAPHSHLQQHRLLGVPLWCTHGHKHKGAKTKDPTHRFPRGSRLPSFCCRYL